MSERDADDPADPVDDRDEPAENHHESIDDPFSAHLGITFEEVTAGAATARMDVTDDLLNAIGILHGGAAFALADSVAGAALNAHLDEDPGVALEANVSFLEAVDAGETVIGTAEITHETASTAEMTVDLSTADGTTVATYRARGYKL